MTTSTNKIINKLATGTLSALLITSMPMTVAMQSANAAVANSASAATNLNNLLKNVKSMTANFSQTTSGAGGKGLSKASRNFSGTMAVQRPNQFRWQIDGTASQLIVANGNTLEGLEVFELGEFFGTSRHNKHQVIERKIFAGGGVYNLGRHGLVHGCLIGRGKNVNGRAFLNLFEQRIGSGIVGVYL